MLSDQPILWYYTDYIGAFIKNGGLRALPDIIPHNIMSIMTASGSVVIHNLPDSMPGRFLSILVVAAMVTGAVRIVKRTGLIEYPIFCLLLALTLSVWNFSPSVRLMLPILPLLAIGLYLEGGVLAGLIRRSLQGKDLGNRVAAYMILAGIFVGMLIRDPPERYLHCSRDSRAAATEPRVNGAQPRRLSLVPYVAASFGGGAGLQ